MSRFNYFYILFLFSFPSTSFTNKQFLLTSTNYFQHIHCNDNLHIKINSIKYFYNKYNCTLDRQYHDATLNRCSNRSSCNLNLRPFLFFHIRHYITECRTIKLKYIRLNYTCANETSISIDILNQTAKNHTKNTIILCLSIILSIVLFAFICSYFRESSITKISGQVNDTSNNQNVQLNTESIYDNQKIQEYELKNVSIVESSSSSTITSLNSKNMITNPSEYDNLIKDTYQPSELLSPLHSNDIISSRSPLKVKFNEKMIN